jgi:uncharacterized protein YjbI with pentapeptide repeats
VLEQKRKWKFDLSGTDLRGAFLPEAHLEGANLVGAHLEGAILNDAHLEGAALFGVHLRNAVFFYTHFDGANLVGAHLEGAQLMMAYMDGVRNLDQAFGDDQTWLPPKVAGALAAPRAAQSLPTALKIALFDADLSHADLLGQSQLNQACATDAKAAAGPDAESRGRPSRRHAERQKELYPTLTREDLGLGECSPRRTCIASVLRAA